MEDFYGKKIELGKIVHIFGRIKNGTAGTLLVSGPAGAGKTSLITRFLLDAEKDGALFSHAKAAPLYRSTPLSTLCTAMDVMVKKAIAQHPKERDRIKKTLPNRLGPDADNSIKLLLDLVPSLSYYFEISHDTPENIKSPNRGQAANAVLLTLLEVFVDSERPLLIFLDDIQWMDSASHSFLRYLALNGLIPGIMLILAFRGDQPESNPDFKETVDLFKILETSCCLTLSGLSKRETRGFFRARLQTRQDLSTLADICQQKTAGNPLYLNQMLDELLEKGAVYQKEGEWICDFSYISSLGFTDNIIALIIKKIGLLEPDSLSLLKQSVCIQCDISVSLLAETSGFAKDKIESLLWKSMQLNLLEKTTTGFSFTHDRIKEAIEGLLTNEEIIEIHRRLTDCFLTDLFQEHSETDLFTLLFHYSFCSQSTTDPTIKKEMASRYFEAGELARSRSAISLSLEYFLTGKTSYPGDIWADNYELALGFCRNISECAYLEGDFDLVERIFAEAQSRTKTFMDRIEVELVKIPYYNTREQGELSLDAGLTILRHLGIPLAKTPSDLSILYSLLKAWGGVVLTPLKRLTQKQMAPGTREYYALKCLNALGAVAYHQSPKKLLPLITATGFNVALKYGNMEEAPVTYIVFGAMLNEITGSVGWGRKLGEMARQISANFTDNRFKTKELTLSNVVLEHWDKSMAQSVSDFERAAIFCLRHGDYEYFAYNALSTLHCMIISSTSFDLLLQRIDEKVTTLERLNNQFALTTASMMKQAILNLSQGAEEPWIFKGDSFDETTLDEGLIKAVPDLYFYKLCIAFYCGRTEIALELKDKIPPHVEIALDAYFQCYYHFLCALLDIEGQNGTKKIKTHLKRLKKYAAQNASVYRSKYLLALGHTLRMRGNPGAKRAYREAEEAARENGFLFEQALALENLGKIDKASGDKKAELNHTAEAIVLYKKWGLKWKHDLFDHESRVPKSIEIAETGKKVDLKKAEDNQIGRLESKDDVEQTLVKMKSLSGASVIHVAYRTTKRWKSEIYIDDHGIHQPATFIELPEKLLSFASATSEVLRADTETVEELILDTHYFWHNRPGSFWVIPGEHQSAVYIENFNTVDNEDTVLRQAKQLLVSLNLKEIPPALTTTINDSGQLAQQCRTIQVYMAKKNNFQDPSLSLSKLAKALNMPQRTVTDALNSCLGQNVNTFINSYRVEAVKKALHDPDSEDKTILDIAFAQGFSSKSTFNEVFKNMAGITPSKYRSEKIN